MVITARKRAERLDEVPLAVNVVSAAELARSSIDGMQSLAAHEPGLYFESMWGGGNAAPVLRGQSQPSTAGDNVGIFVDGVYQAARTAIDIDPLDIERIEVVRGPQSALYGRSTFAGAINYVSKSPTAALSTGATAELGQGEGRYQAVQGWLSGPLPRDWQARIAASARRLDGSARNSAGPGLLLGGYARNAATLSVRNAHPGAQRWSAALSLRYQHSLMDQPPTVQLPYAHYNCGDRSPTTGLWSYYCGDLPVSLAPALTPGLPRSAGHSFQAAAQLAFTFDAIELQAETSYYTASAGLLRDFDASADGDTYGVCTVGSNCSGPAGVVRAHQPARERQPGERPGQPHL